MRLRYLHLPDYGPLKDVAVVFGQNRHIENRKGTINFVVGLNGSGKSSMLRAVYDVFHSLSREELPSFPVTLVYDIKQGDKCIPIVLHRPRGPASESFIRAVPLQLDFMSSDEWQRFVESTVNPIVDNEDLGHCVIGDRLKGDGNLRSWLPTRVLAYTSGETAPWQAMTYPRFPVDELLGIPEEFKPDGERPVGWSEEREYRDPRTSNVLSGSAKIPSSDTAPGFNERCLLLTQEDIRLAAVAVGIWKAAQDLEPRPEEAAQEALRRECKEQLDQRSKHEGVDVARRLLNELDWLWATHASFLFAADGDLPHYTIDPARCYWLYALADAVVRHPLDESLAVVSLGHRQPVRPEELVGEEQLGDLLKLAGEPMRNAGCGAEALRRLLSDGGGKDESLWTIFQSLSTWRASGMLKDVNLTVKRIRQVPDADEQLDDCIISYSGFSDGEQMLLGRMALLLLLRGQENSLLLLDEPESHFNDAWKRQIIDLVDDSIMKNTAAHVVVSTHTSLALTDVFSCEITRLVKEDGLTSAQPVIYPTFGADPGRILLHIFGAPDVIGARAAEFLRSKLDPAKWPEEDRQKLRELIDEIGSGWPRAKLMEILDKMDNPDAP